MDKIEVNLDITKKDMMYLLYVGVLGSISKMFAMLLSVVLLAAMLYCHFVYSTSIWLVVVTIVPVALYVNMLFKSIPKTAEKNYKGSSYFGRKPLLCVDRDFVHIQRKNGDVSDIEIKNLHSAWTAPGYFYFSITQNNTIILPKRQLTEQERSFVKSVISKLPHAKKRNPENPSFPKLVLSFLTVLFIVFCITMVIMSFTGGFTR